MQLPAEVDSITSSFLTAVDRRLPGRLQGLLLHGSLGWGEFFPGSDIDFVAVWDRLPDGRDQVQLAAAHADVRGRHGDRPFDGSHLTAADLAGDATATSGRPVFYQGVFDPAGRIDLNPVTWHELATRPVVVRGSVPPIHTDAAQLHAFTRHNLDTYWRDAISRIERAGPASVGHRDDTVAWCGLGAARLHHLLHRHELTSKSGAGRYVRDHLDPRWNRLARECLRLREDPGTPSL